jgi:hypothetical protein
MLFLTFLRTVTLRHALVILLTFLNSEAHAEQKIKYRGAVGSFTNDFFGDGHDRWRSGSYQKSFYFQRLQRGGFEGVELRARSEIVTPWTPSRQPGGDAAYFTSLGLGGFGHGHFMGVETRIGGEVLVIGDASGMEFIQRSIHEVFGLDASFDPTREGIERVENDVTLRFETEFGKSFQLSGSSMIRPYAELTLGGEQKGTVGMDVVIGSLASAETWTRDVVTGRLLTPQASHIRGVSLIAGWDIQAVSSSVQIPDGSKVALEPTQRRARLGIQSSTGLGSVFVGQAWLSPSFVGQAEPQRVGMLSLSLGF